MPCRCRPCRATPIFVCARDVDLGEGVSDVTLDIDRLPLPAGRYYVWAAFTARGHDVLPWSPVAQFDVSGSRLDPAPRGIVRPVPVDVAHKWDLRVR